MSDVHGHIRRSRAVVAAALACALCCASPALMPPAAHAFPDSGTTVTCEHCNGGGFVRVPSDCYWCLSNPGADPDDSSKPCPACSGSGIMDILVDCPVCGGSGSYDVSQRPVRLDDVTDSVDVLGMVIADEFDTLFETLSEYGGSVVSLDTQQFDKIAKFSTGGVFALVVVVALLSVVCGLLFASILVRLWRSR